MESRKALFTMQDEEAMRIASIDYIKALKLLAKSAPSFPNFNTVVDAWGLAKKAILCLSSAAKLHQNEIDRQRESISNYQLFLDQSNKHTFGIFKPKITIEAVNIADRMHQAYKTIDNESFLSNHLINECFARIHQMPETQQLYEAVPFPTFNYNLQSSSYSRTETYSLTFKDGTKIELHDLSEKSLKNAKQEYDDKVNSLNAEKRSNMKP